MYWQAAGRFLFWVFGCNAGEFEPGYLNVAEETYLIFKKMALRLNLWITIPCIEAAIGYCLTRTQALLRSHFHQNTSVDYKHIN